MSVMIETHLPTLEAKGRVKLLRTAVKYFGVKQVSGGLMHLLLCLLVMVVKTFDLL